MSSARMSNCATGLTGTVGGAPKISVLVATYNYARYLPETIESVLAQDYRDCEILISDDASTDDSARIIREYAACDPRIRFVLQPSNLGMVANWNWCLQQARGDYIKFLFGDDMLASPETLSRLAAMLDANPSAQLAASARLLFDENSKVNGLWNDLSAGLHDGAAVIARCLRTRRNLVGEPSAVMFRRQAAQRGYDPAFRQIVDLEMWFHLLLQGHLVYTPEPLCLFRRHSRQQTAINGESRVSDGELIELLDRYLETPALHAHLQPGSVAHRRILFRQMHYARKASARSPAAASAVARLRSRLPFHWLILLWLGHRLTRPLENLHRKILSWTRRLAIFVSAKTAVPSANRENFPGILARTRARRFVVPGSERAGLIP